MPRRVDRSVDFNRTELLGIDELFVQRGKGNDEYFVTWQHESAAQPCPYCGSQDYKTHDLFGREYIDVIRQGDSFQSVKILYEFYKYRCLNPDCGKIFHNSIDFASINDNVTHRLENTVADLVIKGYSYGEIEDILSYSLTRQAVGQIFNRWGKNKLDYRVVKKSPKHLAVISGKTDLDQYTIFLNLDNGVRIFDAIYGVNSLDIVATLKSYGLTSIDTLISDCDPTIYDVINDNLPESTYIIPIYYWFKLVNNDFAEYSHNVLKWCTVKDKDDIILRSEEELGFRTSDLQAIKDARPDIIQPHRDYNELRDIIRSRDEQWTYNKIRAWTETVCPGLKKELNATILRLELYREAIYQHELHPERVPENLFYLTEGLEKEVSSMRTYSDACLKARLLFSVETDTENWQGVPIEEVTGKLKEINNYGGSINDY